MSSLLHSVCLLTTFCPSFLKTLSTMTKKGATVSSFSWCSIFCSSSPFSCSWNRMHCEEMPLLPPCFPFLRSLRSEVKDRNQISPHHSPVCKIEMSLSLEIRWNSDHAVEFRTSLWVCLGNGFCITREQEVSPGERGQRSYKRLMFALYIAAAHTGM